MAATLKIEPTKIRELVEDYRSGRLVIPEFQRDYVWHKKKAPLLLDSLYRSFPIAALLTWQSSEYATPRRRNPRPLRGAHKAVFNGSFSRMRRSPARIRGFGG